MTVLALVSDAYGSRGGVAAVNRDLFAALAAGGHRIDVISRAPLDEAVPALPPGVRFDARSTGGAVAFGRAFGSALVRGRYDAVFCGHLHLAPFAALAAARAGVPYVLMVHGIEAWGPPHWPDTQRPAVMAATLAAARRATVVVAPSAFSLDRFARRARLRPGRGAVVPNGVDLTAFAPGPRRADLVARHGLTGRRVVMTMARLNRAEHYKGLDEVIAALPALGDDVTYLVCGTGDDRPRLDALAQAAGVGDRVVFAGYVPEAEKADHYRLADAFAMPGRGEGFGIVYLEAMACGVPVVASSADASQEAVQGGALGFVVDPDDPDAVREGIRSALAAPKGVPPGLEHFSQARFGERWRAVFAPFVPPARQATHSAR